MLRRRVVRHHSEGCGCAAVSADPRATGYQDADPDRFQADADRFADSGSQAHPPRCEDGPDGKVEHARHEGVTFSHGNKERTQNVEIPTASHCEAAQGSRCEGGGRAARGV